MFYRDAAFSMEIRNPGEPDNKSPLVQALTIGGELLVFKETSIHKVLTADIIDPERKEMNTRHSHELLYSVGTTSPFVARMILQFQEMIALCIPDEMRNADIAQHVWKANRLLLECEKVCHHIYKHTMDLMSKCDETIEAHKSKEAIPALPKVPDLETHVEIFFIKGKHFLVATYELLYLFYQMPMNDKNEAHFNKHREWIKAKLGEGHPIYRMLEDDESWVRSISECSNAIRHGGPGFKLEFKNFALNPGNKFSAPAWRYDLTKNGLERQDGYSDLIQDLQVRMHNMWSFFEDLLLLCLQDELKEHKLLTVVRKRKEEINPKCPIVYEINLKI